MILVLEELVRFLQGSFPGTESTEAGLGEECEALTELSQSSKS